MNDSPKTVGDAVLEVLTRQGGPMELDSIVEAVLTEYSTTTKDNVKQELTKLKAANRVKNPERGVWSLRQPGELTEVEKIDSSGNAGIIIRDADTRKAWFAVEFPPYLRVVNALEVFIRPDANLYDSEADG